MNDYNYSLTKLQDNFGAENADCLFDNFIDKVLTKYKNKRDDEKLKIWDRYTNYLIKNYELSHSMLVKRNREIGLHDIILKIIEIENIDDVYAYDKAYYLTKKYLLGNMQRSIIASETGTYKEFERKMYQTVYREYIKEVKNDK